MAENSSFARTMINMLNSHYSPTVYRREDGRDIRLNIIKMFNLNPVNFNSNKKLNIDYWKLTNNVTFASKDGIKIAASVCLNEKPSNKWIVAMHGYNSSRFEVLYLVWHYRELGYNIITFDFRNHGASENDAVTWGFKEKWDMIATIEWLISAYQVDEMGLIGTSMGGFTLNYFSLTEPELIKKANIRWGISDSAYMSAPKQLEKIVYENSPKILKNFGKETLKNMMKIYEKEYGADLTNLDYLSMIKPKEKHFPILYIHNRGDRITNYLDSFRMWNTKNNLEETTINELIIFDGTHHTKAMIEHTKEYKEKSLLFVRKHEKK
ncbi:alpha/beta hydrolase [Williamsoniiplasma lucivorax]|uniref:Hydrolase n=1 Tax=Williamsoniiplasma lucivorax TaxID=209274 RepID=A0A2S5RDS5_9MOLU|nr:alpha/beta hydrolase [Williamsoniiplasma lucivorax]PPE05454.1 hydrolase [Williamsoniiplasma lucivorax]